MRVLSDDTNERGAREHRTREHEAPKRLKRRAEFLRVSNGLRWHGTAMTIQTAARRTETHEAATPDAAAPRFGFTLTKKVGNAVIRNRARRRLREAVRLAADLPARDGHDYVIVGRLDALRVPFAALGAELARGVEAVHARGKRRGGRTGAASAADRPKGTRPSS